MRRYVVFYGKTKKGIVAARTRQEAVEVAFSEYGKHRRDRVKIYVYALDLAVERARQRGCE